MTSSVKEAMLKLLMLSVILMFLINLVSAEENFSDARCFHRGLFGVCKNNDRKEILCMECPSCPPGLQSNGRCRGLKVLDWTIDCLTCMCFTLTHNNQT